MSNTAQAANEYMTTHRFTQIGGEMERVSREVAFSSFIAGAAWAFENEAKRWDDIQVSELDSDNPSQYVIDAAKRNAARLRAQAACDVDDTLKKDEKTNI